MRSSNLRTSLVGILLAVLHTLLLSACSNSPPPNVILISVDTLNRDAISAFSNEAPRLPNIDALADRSARLQHATTPAPWTLPAHGSLLTGRYPNRHGATDARRRLTQAIPTLAGQLQQQGYNTVAFTDGGFVDKEYGFARGFERYDSVIDEEHVESPGERPYWATGIPRKGARAEPIGSALFDRAIALLDNRPPAAGPLLLFLQTYAVHEYYRVRPWATSQLPAFEDRESDYYWECIHGRSECSSEIWNRLRNLYRAEVMHLDSGLGNLLDTLERRNLTEDTYVVFLSDHGEGFAPKLDRTHHGGRLHEDQIRIPMLVSGPGIQPADISTPTSLIDIMPTLLELLDLPVPQGLDGASLAGILRGSDSHGGRLLLAMDHYFFWSDSGRARAEDLRQTPLAISGMVGDSWYLRDKTGEYLFNLSDDPRQLHNLIADGDAPTTWHRRLDARGRVTVDSKTPQNTDTLQEQLRALGYVQ